MCLHAMPQLACGTDVRGWQGREAAERVIVAALERGRGGPR
jgi:hypothetical protein